MQVSARVLAPAQLLQKVSTPPPGKCSNIWIFGLKDKDLSGFTVGPQIAPESSTQYERARQQFRAGSAIPWAERIMAYKETFWMACDSTESLRAEYGPFHNRAEAEAEARKLGFHYLLRYEHLLDENEEIQEVRCIFVELPGAVATESSSQGITISLHTRCATCGESASHDKPWQAEVWADIHEFEHTRHFVRLFEHARGQGLKEVSDWRG